MTAVQLGVGWSGKGTMASSFVASAEEPGQDFTIHNLPLGVGRANSGESRVYTRIGDQAVDLRALSEAGLLSGPVLSSKVAKETLGMRTLNAFADLGPTAATELRHTLQRLLSSQEGVLR